MFTRVLIRNFKCLRQLGVKIKPLSVVIGANDTGKSTFLHALSKLCNRQSFEGHDRWRDDTSNEIEIVGTTNEGDLRVGVDSKRGFFAEGPRGLSFNVGQYQLPSEGVALHSEGTTESGLVPVLNVNGSNISAFLDFLLRRDRVRFDQIEQSMRDLIPGFERIHIVTPQPATRRIDLEIDNGFVIQGDRASAGVRLLIFFVCLAYHPNPPDLILIEEPENGVHPKRLETIVNLMRDITKGVHGGHQAQIILSTHSPYLLDLVDLEQDQVLVFSREADGSRTARAADAERLKRFKGEFMLGEVWYNEGEEGLITKKAS